MKARKWAALVAVVVFGCLGFGRPAHAQCSAAVDGHGSSAYEASHLIKNTAGTLCNLTINFHTAAYRTILLIDAPSIPSDGALPSCDNGHSPCVRYCFEGLAQSTDPTESVEPISFVGTGLKFYNGIVVAASTSTNGCNTLTSDSAEEWFNWQAP